MMTICGLNNRLMILLSICILGGVSCSQQERTLTPEMVEGIRFLYMPKGIEMTHAITDCRDVINTGMTKDTTIYDRKIIDKYVGFIQNLRPVPNESCDFRVCSVIKLKDSDKLMFIGFGESFFTAIDNKRMNDDPKLFQWLDSLLYSNHQKVDNQ